MKKRNSFLLLAAGAAACAASAVNGQTTAFTYQGKLTDDCCPATGYYDLTFKVFDGAGPGTTGQQGSTLALTRVPVTNGLFTVSLDFGSSVFTGARRWLQIDARTNNPALTPVTLLPRTELTATPYALYAQKAGMVTSGSVTTNALDTTAAPTANQILSFNGSSLQWINTPSGTFSLPYSGTLSSPLSLLTLNNTGTGSAATFTGPRDQIRIQGTAVGAPNLAWADFADSAGTLTGFVGDASSSDTDVYLGAYSGSVALYTPGGRVLTATPSGNVGIGTEIVNNRLSVAAGFDGDGVAVVGTSSTRPFYRYVTRGNPPSFSAAWHYMDATDGNKWKLHLGASLTSQGADVLTVTPSAQVGIGTTSPQTTLDVAGAVHASRGVSGEAIGISYGRGVFGLANNDPNSYGGLFQYGTDGNNAAYLGGNGVAADFYGPVYVHGNASVNVLTITGGADLAEPFQMSTRDVPKGALVVIDDENAGQLRMSDRAYDTRVAGILSGANGVNPGIQLHQQGALEGGENVALSGRVYALADASEVPIKPGDLLTTSDTPGHCMKVTSAGKAQGAIIGKAMSALKEGKGMVLVLVSLQ